MVNKIILKSNHDLEKLAEVCEFPIDYPHPIQYPAVAVWQVLEGISNAGFLLIIYVYEFDFL